MLVPNPVHSVLLMGIISSTALAKLSSSEAMNLYPLIPLAMTDGDGGVDFKGGCGGFLVFMFGIHKNSVPVNLLPNFCVCITNTLTLARFKCICDGFGEIYVCHKHKIYFRVAPFYLRLIIFPSSKQAQS